MSEKNYNYTEESTGSSHRKDNRRKFKKNNVLFTALLVILTSVSIVQTVQSATILSKVDEIQGSGVSNTNLSGSLSDLPDMVGGC